MSEAGGVVIVGAGHAGFNLVLALQKEKFTGPVTLLGDEGELPYHRPPLSKTYVKGDITDDKLWMRPEKFYQDAGVALHLSSPVEKIDRENQIVVTQDGDFAYETLVLATGTRPRFLPVPGADLDGVEVIRTLQDARAIRGRLPAVKSVVVVGGGFIGMEFAAAAQAMGKSVSVLETAPRILGRAVAPATSEYVASRLAGTGVDIHVNVQVKEISGSGGTVAGISCEDGAFFAADLIVVGIGVTPESGLAEDCGLACDNGIRVDANMRTSDSRIFAIGDCAAHLNRFGNNREIRLESVQNATDQARTVAKIIGGQDSDTEYNAVPWFWSDLGDIKLQMVGLSLDADEFVVRGHPEDGRFSVFHFRENQLVAIDSVNQAPDHMAGRKLIAASVSPTAEQVQDVGLNLKSLLPDA